LQIDIVRRQVADFDTDAGDRAGPVCVALGLADVAITKRSSREDVTIHRKV
jgi:hypothetical protein